MVSTNSNVFEFRDIVGMIVSRWYMIIILLAVMLFLSNYYSKRNESISYVAKASIIIGNSLDSEGKQFRIEDISKIQSFMGTYCTLARSMDVMEEVIKKYNLKMSSESLQNSLTVISQPNTQFLDLTIKWGNPQEAVLVVNAVADTFVNYTKGIYPTIDIKVMGKADNVLTINKSNKKLYMVLGAVSGVMLSLLIIFALEWFDNTIRNEDDVNKYLGIPVVGNIPKYKKMLR